jgi:hypothetical protein
MRAVSRRGIIAGLLATTAAPAAAVHHKPPDVPKPTFIKGMIMPRSVLVADPRLPGGWGHAQPVVVYEYEIFDGEKFVALNSGAGQQVVRELGG